ncbi:MAG: hypothetical protein ACD_28C00011G0018 [uncultured bacterium]|nr:MAG: hypothetical protein ACD_28C00011G0018 [uncultured bacterium]
MDKGGTENVAGIEKRQGDAWKDFERLFVREAMEITEGFFRIFGGVVGLNGRLSPFEFLRIDVLSFLFLNMGTVEQHVHTQITRCKGGINGPLKSFLDQPWQSSAVIDVRMR